MRKLAVLFGLILAMAIAATPAVAESVEDISKELMCQCGCTMIVYNCDCTTAGQMKDVIRTKLEEGQNRQQILAYFSEQYGETVLSAPTKEGFNLTAWIFPFVAIVVGAVIVYIVLTRWVISKGQPEYSFAEAESAGELDAYEERFRRELQEFQGS